MTFSVRATLPPALEPLRQVATDLHWAWNHDSIALLRRLDADLWEEAGHNPVLMLGSIDQERLDEASLDPVFLAHMERVVQTLDGYVQQRTTWFRRHHGDGDGLQVAYFSLEFGLTECLSIFAGGLGILAGDHLKSASDLGVPLVGVGLLYQEGYFHQVLNDAGFQQEIYTPNDFGNLPIQQELQSDGRPLVVETPFPDGPLRAYVWRVTVGRITLYLLDAKHPDNDAAGQEVTRQLYGGDRANRLRQEVLLGVGGVRALEAMGIEPTVYHINEGHSAFLILERIVRIMEEQGLDFAAAREAAAGLVFTTHTPVEAGHDYFSPQLIERYLGQYATAAGITIHELLGLGRRDPTDWNEEFCNTVLGLRCAAYTNGVSKLHGEVSRSMWRGVWPDVPESDVPIGSITNGVHFESWVSDELKELYDRYLGPQWREEPADASVWSRASKIPPAELWRIHQLRTDRLVGFARRRLSAQLAGRGASQAEIDVAEVVLDPNALTIGFSRRFATYKRATLLLSNPDRLEKILTNEERPVQLIFAGKAHPNDQEGKELIRSIIELTRRPGLRRHLVFIADYDMAVARYLVQGSDVWLNTPVRPLEASGTSGMKAAANGVLNLSTLDGWWDEAFEPDVGWAIGGRNPHPDPAARDQSEAHALYDLLEYDIVPLFYERGADRLPRRWIERMQASMAKLNGVYNTHRMVREYTERYYLPANRRSAELNSDGGRRAVELAEWRQRMYDAWERVRVVELTSDHGTDAVSVNERVPVRATLDLGGIDADSVAVELYQGPIDADGNVADGLATPMRLDGPADDGNWTYSAEVTFARSGTSGFTVRVVPSQPDLVTRMIPGLITWA